MSSPRSTALSAYVESLLAVIEVRQADIAALAAKRDELRATLRETERDLQMFEGQVRALSEIVAQESPTKLGKVRSIGRRRDGGKTSPPLIGMSRVQAIETILHEAEGGPLHRNAIWDEMRERGFLHETLGDTSAGLAYLKRLGRVINPTRGYWQLQRVVQETG